MRLTAGGSAGCDDNLVSEARAGTGRYLSFYNSRRPHSALDRKTPDQAYFKQPMPDAVAA